MKSNLSSSHDPSGECMLCSDKPLIPPPPLDPSDPMAGSPVLQSVADISLTIARLHAFKCTLPASGHKGSIKTVIEATIHELNDIGQSLCTVTSILKHLG